MSDIIEDESKTSWFSKFKKDPILTGGIAVYVGLVGYAVYNYKKRGSKHKLSNYVIYTRLVAQSAIVSCVCGSLLYKLYNDYKAHNYPPLPSTEDQNKRWKAAQEKKTQANIVDFPKIYIYI